MENSVAASPTLWPRNLGRSRELATCMYCFSKATALRIQDIGDVMKRQRAVNRHWRNASLTDAQNRAERCAHAGRHARYHPLEAPGSTPVAPSVTYPSPLTLGFLPKADREAFSAAPSSAHKLYPARRYAVRYRKRANARPIRRTVDRTLADAQNERPALL